MSAHVHDEDPGERGPERRGTAPPKLVVVDFASVFPEWVDPIPPAELIARSVLLRTLAEARRGHDVYLIGTPKSLARSAAEVFEDAAIVIESDDPDEEKELSGEFLHYERTGVFGELVVVSCDRRFLDVMAAFKADGRSVRVISMWEHCDVVMKNEADLSVFFPSFDASGGEGEFAA